MLMYSGPGCYVLWIDSWNSITKSYADEDILSIVAKSNVSLQAFVSRKPLAPVLSRVQRPGDQGQSTICT
jgi:hypothetical protein